MSLDTLSIPPVNWPLFLFTSLIICLRASTPLICTWFSKKFYSPSTKIDEITHELKCVTAELRTLSQQDQFAAYTRKERLRNSLVERLKDVRNSSEAQQKNLSNSIRMILNIGTVLIMIILTIKSRGQDAIPLFNFAFFQFPLIIWVMALNTFVSTLVNIYLRYRTN
ncbi:unnamed protein product [Rotaria sp. Silwood1]|nr:unnamed protein product [Rotaria sp. Silwood1]CAF3538900.1 unnamed protein product [Rotaria sp. Silwood1]CAF4584752.1 unnamed protein product [Rotaria sp. Silwood1]